MELTRTFLRRAAFPLLIVGTFVACVHAAEYVVDSTEDSGSGSLRSAILAANLNPGSDSIVFRIPGPAPHSIVLESELPTITDPLKIEAQFAQFTDPRTIEIDGKNTGAEASGLHLAVGNCVVRGLAIGGFGAHGILLDGFGQHLIAANFLGTDAQGNLRLNQAAGIAIVDSSQNQIGGVATNQGNLISGNATGVFISGSASQSNLVLGNFIGPDLGGSVGLGNVQNGVLIYGGVQNVIGGSVPGARNIISVNQQSGVYFYGPDTRANHLEGNFIGLAADGKTPLGNGIDGVTIFDASHNFVGSTNAGAGNVISGNAERGIFITGENAASGNTIQGNFIGTDSTGSSGAGNGFSGVAIQDVSSNQVGGATAQARNIISGNLESGILLQGAGAIANVLLGNFIGTDRQGITPLSNAFNGISIIGAPSNIIGGSTSNAGNLVSANGQSGVLLAEVGASGNYFEGNLIGLDSGGKRALGNSFAGLRLESGGNFVGHAGGLPNIISGNGHSGIEVFGPDSSSNVFQGNWIGTDISGRTGLGNAGGVAISESTGNLLGGATPGSGNIISGNDDSGVFLVDSGTTQNIVQGNFIGTDPSGAVPVPNNGDGISIFGASATLIGGTNFLAGNIISANLQDGILITQASASNNIVQGNGIGTAGDRTSPLWNRTHGIELDQGASGNLIGGESPAANHILANQSSPSNGVQVNSGQRNTIRRNLIFAGQGLAIDLGGDGPSINDGGDPDNGANLLLNYPLVTSALASSTTEIKGTLNSSPAETFLLDFYVTPSSAEISNAQALAWLGTVAVLTDARGNASFDVSLPGSAVAGSSVAVSSTDAKGNTSELSAAFRVTALDDDADGLPNAYELAHGLNPKDRADATKDSDGDGLTNLQEYRAGTDPFDPAGALRLSAELLGSNGLSLGFLTVVGRLYTIQYADALGTWHTLKKVPGDGTRATLSELRSPAASRFYRITIPQ